MLRESLQLGPFLCYACTSGWQLFLHPHLHHLLFFYLLLLYRACFEATFQGPFKEAGPSPLQSMTAGATALCGVQYFGFQSVNWVDSIQTPAYFRIISMKVLQPERCQALQCVLWCRKMTIYEAFMSLKTSKKSPRLIRKQKHYSQLGPCTDSCSICPNTKPTQEGKTLFLILLFPRELLCLCLVESRQKLEIINSSVQICIPTSKAKIIQFSVYSNVLLPPLETKAACLPAQTWKQIPLRLWEHSLYPRSNTV